MGLLSAARRRLETIPVPDDDHVFIHGDSWLGNPVWTGENKLSGMIDWDAAGVGAARIDLGSLRFDVTVLYGAAAADEVVHGWAVASGRPAVNLAYWEDVAASCTTADMSPCVPTLQELGRTDLNAALLQVRRDDFLVCALERLERN